MKRAFVIVVAACLLVFACSGVAFAKKEGAFGWFYAGSDTAPMDTVSMNKEFTVNVMMNNGQLSDGLTVASAQFDITITNAEFVGYSNPEFGGVSFTNTDLVFGAGAGGQASGTATTCRVSFYGNSEPTNVTDGLLVCQLKLKASSNVGGHITVTVTDSVCSTTGDTSERPLLFDEGGHDPVDIEITDQASIARLSGTYAKDTSAAICREAFQGKSDYAIVACDYAFADAMSASGLAGTLNCPILLSDYQHLSTSARDEIVRLGAKHVYLIGGRYAMYPAVLEEIEAIPSVEDAERIWGTYSWDTSVACAQKIADHDGNPQNMAIVSQSGNFQDALSMSAYAYKYGVPIFLEMDRSGNWMLPPDAETMIRNMNGRIYVAGGKYAVDPNSVEDKFLGRDIVRLAGTTGYDTSNVIANYMVDNNLMSAGTVCIAYGGLECNGLDALSGGALAGMNGGVMLLVDSWSNPQQIQTIEGRDAADNPAFLTKNKEAVASCYILGGKYVVQPWFFTKVKTIIDAEGIDPSA